MWVGFESVIKMVVKYWFKNDDEYREWMVSVNIINFFVSSDLM